MSTIMAKAPVSIVRGNTKIFVNDPSLLKTILESLEPIAKENIDVFGIHKLAFDLQDALARNSDRHFANLRDAIYHNRPVLSKSLTKRINTVNAVHSFMKHFTAPLCTDLLWDLEAELASDAAPKSSHLDIDNDSVDHPGSQVDSTLPPSTSPAEDFYMGELSVDFGTQTSDWEPLPIPTDGLQKTIIDAHTEETSKPASTKVDENLGNELRQTIADRAAHHRKLHGPLAALPREISSFAAFVEHYTSAIFKHGDLMQKARLNAWLLSEGSG
jgi:hypothetical protein